MGEGVVDREQEELAFSDSNSITPAAITVILQLLSKKVNFSISHSHLQISENTQHKINKNYQPIFKLFRYDKINLYIHLNLWGAHVKISENAHKIIHIFCKETEKGGKEKKSIISKFFM